MTFHQRSRIPTGIDYGDYFNYTVGQLGCCCTYGSGSITAAPSAFNECSAANGYYFLPPLGVSCSTILCPYGGLTGCCCSCKNMTKEQRALADADILGSTHGMVDNVGKCACEDSGGRWIFGPCDRTKPILHCRQVNGVDVRLPKACCGVTFIPASGGGAPQITYTPYCEDVCTAKECSEKVVLNYAATFYNTGRRCFFANNAGGPVATECQLTQGDNRNTTLPPPTRENLFFPRCNNSNFICWGNECSNYVNLINNGFYYNPSVNDYRILQHSGGASKLEDFDSIDTNKKVIGNGLFTPFTRNYIHIKSRFGRAGFITQDNKVLFAGAELPGIINGIEYTPAQYNTDPFYKYDHVEIGKNFAIIRKTSNIGTRADFIGYLSPELSFTQSELNYSGVQTVHALEEAACISRLNFLTNNVELFCKGYPFSMTGLTLVDGGNFVTYHHTIDPDTISCNGYHCTYQRYKLTPGRTLIEKEWITAGEYKRIRDNFGNPLPIPYDRIFTALPSPKTDFSDGIVVAGHNFDCFMEAVSQNPETQDGYTKLSCYGIWDPEDTNFEMNFTNHEFGILNTRPEKGSAYYDCDYNKCFAVMPTASYCESNSSGICCIVGSECDCRQNVTQSECEALNGNFYEPGTYRCSECEEECGSQGGGGGEDEPPACCDEFPYDNANCDCSYAGTCQNFTNGNGVTVKKGACCVTETCPQTGTIRYSVKCRTQEYCSFLGGIFHENKKPVDVNCGPLDTPGNCCYNSRATDGNSASGQCFNCQRETGTCIEGWTNRQCMKCAHINENNVCILEDDNGQSQPFNSGSYWSASGDCCNC